MVQPEIFGLNQTVIPFEHAVDKEVQFLILMLRYVWKNPRTLLVLGGFLGFQVFVSMLTGLLICMGGIF